MLTVARSKHDAILQRYSSLALTSYVHLWSNAYFPTSEALNECFRAKLFHDLFQY